MNKALFLDRDGVININHGHVHTIEKFDFINGIFDLCRFFQNAGYLIFVITNQAGIGKGFYTLQEFKKLNQWMLDVFSNNGINIIKTYFCPHTPEDMCDCRKPNPGLILEAQKEYNIDLKKSVFIGDKESDMLAGKRANVGTLLHFKGNSHFDTLIKIKELKSISIV